MVITKCSTIQLNEFILTRILQKKVNTDFNQPPTLVRQVSLTLIHTKYLFNLSQHTVNLFSQCESQSTVLPLYVYPAGTWFFAFLGREQTRTGGVKKMYSFQYTKDLHFGVFLPQLVKVSCIFCTKFFTGLSYRPPETRDGVLYPSSPSLNVQSASVHANQSKFLEYSTVHS